MELQVQEKLQILRKNKLLLLEYSKTDMQLHNWLNFAINDNKFLENLNKTKQNSIKREINSALKR